MDDDRPFQARSERAGCTIAAVSHHLDSHLEHPVTDPAQFEFTSNQNQLIGSLGSKMRLVGLVMVIMGVCTLLMAVGIAVGGQSEAKLKELPKATFWSIVGYYAVAGFFYLLLGSWTRSAASSFRQIVDTRGQDISRLMDALGSL